MNSLIKTNQCQICCSVHNITWYSHRNVCRECLIFFKQNRIDNTYLGFKCNQNQSCVITFETRKECNFCRYKKCQDLGMNLVSWQELEAKCLVCAKPAHGIHYGILTCKCCQV